MTPTKLLPCPFCGGEPLGPIQDSEKNGPVYCRHCQARSLSPHWWNQRQDGHWVPDDGPGSFNGAKFVQAEPRGQALPEMWSEEKMQVCLEIGGIHGALGQIRALQQHILSAKAVEWRKVRKALETAISLTTKHGYLATAQEMEKMLSLLPAEEGEPDAKV